MEELRIPVIPCREFPTPIAMRRVGEGRPQKAGSGERPEPARISCELP